MEVKCFISLVVYIFIFNSFRPTNGANVKNPSYKSTFKEPSLKDGYYAEKKIPEIIDNLENMMTEIDQLQTIINKNTHMLEDLQDAVKADENYWNQTNACGGLVEAQTGRITAGNLYYSSHCVWTIHANNRMKIKVNMKIPLQLSTSYSYDRAWNGCEMFEIEFGAEGPGGPQTLKSTKITGDTTYIFKGPIIFLSCVVSRTTNYGSSGDSSGVLYFEGIGSNAHRQVNFKSLNYVNANGSFESFFESNPSNVFNKSMEYTTLIIYPGLAMSKLSVLGDIGLSACRNNFSLYIYQNFTDPSAPVYDCCKIDCQRKQFLITKQFFLITTSTSSPKNNSDVELIWRKHENLYSFSTVSQGYCGGQLSGGNSGVMNYSLHKNNRRCVWAIHTFPKTDVRVFVSSTFADPNHDALVAVEIDAEKPITTRLHSNNYYNLTGRVVLIMLYSDNTIAGGSIALKWTLIGDYNFDTLSNDNKLFRTEIPSAQVVFNASSWSQITTKGLHTFIINPQEVGPNSMHLTIANVSLDGNAELRILGSKNANFSAIFVSTESIVEQNFTSWDGVFVVILEIKDFSSDGSFEMSWQLGENTLPAQYTTCGGIVNGQTGTINYLAGFRYPKNDRCIWILHSPYNSVTLTLRKSGFGNDQDTILIDVMDPDNGKLLPNQTSTLRSTSQTVTVKGPLIIVTFQSHASPPLTRQGFLLDFIGSGASISVDHKFRMVHVNEQSGTFTYPAEDEETLKPDEMLILAFSRIPRESEVGPTLGKPSAIIVTLEIDSESEERRFDTDLDKLNLYSHEGVKSFHPVAQCSISYGNPADECDFLNTTYSTSRKDNSTGNMTISAGNSFAFPVNYSAFLLTFKPASNSAKPLTFNVSWEVDTQCGGIRIGDSGVIEYKLYEEYDSDEHCVWTVQAPGNTQIEFSITSGGSYYDFDHCDQVILTPLNVELGTLGYSTRLGGAYRSRTVSSSAAIVTFHSDTGSQSYGFKITYTATGIVNEDDRFHIRHITSTSFYSAKNRLTVPSKSQSPMKANELFIVSFNPLGTVRTHGNTAVSFNKLKLFVDDTCKGDFLTFYQFSKDYYYTSSAYCNSVRMYSLALSSSYRPHKNTSLCSQNASRYDIDDYYDEYSSSMSHTCSPACYQVDVLPTLQRDFLSITSPFIAVYKSVTNKSDTHGVIDFEWESAVDYRNRQTTSSTTETAEAEEDQDPLDSENY